MEAPLHYFHSQPASPPHADVVTVSRSDVQWNRPIFKAPPLHVQPPVRDVALFTAELRRKERPIRHAS